MKKLILWILIFLLPFPSLAYASDRYYYVGRAKDNDYWYVDTQSLQHDESTNIVRFWCICVLSFSSRKNKPLNVYQIKYCIDVNLSSNKFLLIEEHDCDSRGYIVKSQKFHSQSWNNVLPTSNLEAILRALNTILKEKKSTQSTQPAGINMGTGNIIMFSLLIGTVVSILAVFILKALLPDKSDTTPNYNSSEAHNDDKYEADYINVDFAEKVSDDDFDYPYEDIGDALRE